eukprot:SM000192S04900  [mRNA]  locus=s192:24950:30395:- [translate_table: standard]
MAYPAARRDDGVVEDYHGTKVADPYRWMEDPDAEETKAFVEAQNAVTQAVLASCDTREPFRERMAELYNYPKYGCPYKRGSRYFYFFNAGLQAQSVLYMQLRVPRYRPPVGCSAARLSVPRCHLEQASLDAEGEVLLDPNLLSEDGTVALSGYAFSEDGAYLAYGLSASGSDWQEIRVLRVHDKHQEPDHLRWVKFSSMAWTHDHKGFFYNKYPEPTKATTGDAGTETDINLNQKLYYHVLGDDQAADTLCWEDPDNPKWMFGAELSDDGRYIVMSISEGCDPVNRLYYCDLETLPGSAAAWKGEGLLPMVKLVDNFGAQYGYVTNDGTDFVFHTNKDAPLYKLTKVSLDAPESWSDLIAECERDVLEWAYCVRDNVLLTCYLHDVKHILQIRDLGTGNVIKALPLDVGSVSSATGRKQDSQIFFSFTSFLSPGTIYSCELTDLAVLQPKVFREIKVNGFDASHFETKQVFVTSKDGTAIPMFVVSRKGIALDGSHPALLYGYGGFNISLTPSFSVARVVLMRHYGAVVAVANIRGGGEYGEKWHKAGSLANKQNCFDDFQKCAEFLTKEGYTQPSKLCIEGGSNGGLLVAACINERPELYGCAIAHVGVMDMLRFHKFTIGHAWTTDYGCSDKAEEFQWLIKYSPLHNVSRPWELPSGDVQYPSTMLLTGDHDDRVVPLHTLKLIATLQHELCQVEDGAIHQTNPIIVRVDTKAGHGAGRPTQKMIDEVSDVYSFMAKVTGASWQE